MEAFLKDRKTSLSPTGMRKAAFLANQRNEPKQAVAVPRKERSVSLLTPKRSPNKKMLIRIQTAAEIPITSKTAAVQQAKEVKEPEDKKAEKKDVLLRRTQSEPLLNSWDIRIRPTVVPGLEIK
jgi:hypothetical protein